MVLDRNTFEEWDTGLATSDPLEFPGYLKKLEHQKSVTNLEEAVITGKGKIGGSEAAIAVMSADFMMGSMGQVVGEKITRAIERATDQRIPIIIFTCSGGARMQEGIISLMQMEKTSAALRRHDQAGLLYISVLTDPTTGGVTASLPCWEMSYWRNREHWLDLQGRESSSRPSVRSFRMVSRDLNFCWSTDLWIRSLSGRTCGKCLPPL